MTATVTVVVAMLMMMLLLLKLLLMQLLLLLANPIEPCSQSSSGVDEVKSIIGRKHCSLSLSLSFGVCESARSVCAHNKVPIEWKKVKKKAAAPFIAIFLKLERLSLVSTRH